MKAQARFSRTIVFAFGAFALAFLCSTVGTSWIAGSIGQETEVLAADALPSVEHLTACDALRDIESHADDYPNLPATRQPAARQALDEDWRKLDVELSAYLRLPAWTGEHERYEAQIPPALREVEASLTRLFVQVDAHDLEAAELTADHEVREATNEAAQRLRNLVRFNTTHARAAVERIEGTHRLARRSAFVLDAIAVVLGLLLGVWTLRRFRAQAELTERHAASLAERADELEVFGKRVAHDLLSPLSALTYCLGAFKRVSETEPKLADALTRARACVMRAQRMVDGIFEFARAGGRPEPGARANVRDGIEQAREELRTTTDPPGVTVAEFEDCFVACSPGVLGSVLGNLMSNATKYMSDSAVKRIAIRVRPRGSSVEVEIEDTGPGIPSAIEQRLFEPYVRAEGVTQPGLGLGLATVRRLCEAHGGEIAVRSVEGRGAVFRFSLPRAGADSDRVPFESGASAAVRRIG
jgi:signal transduction histidine kinase